METRVLPSRPVTADLVQALNAAAGAAGEKSANILVDALLAPKTQSNVRDVIVEKLKGSPFTSVAERLAAQLNRGDGETRVPVAKALHGSQFPCARAALIEAIGLANNPPPRLIHQAALSLRPVNDEKEVARLAIILESRGSFQLGAPADAICVALTGTTSATGLAILEDLVMNPEIEISPKSSALHCVSPRWGNRAAATALAHTPISEELLLKLIARALDRSNENRWFAICALHQRSETVAQEALRNIATRDPEEENRMAAAQGIIARAA